MGSLFSTSQAAPTPPAPPSSTRDEVNGVEQVPVTNADGSITYVTRAIPLTAEQQAEKDQLDAIMQESLGEIQKLSATDYVPGESTQKVLDQWTQAQNKLLNDQLTKRSDLEESTLAKRGIGDSSAAQDVRRQRLLDTQDAEKNLSLQKDELANQIRSQQLNLQQNLYNLAASATSAKDAKIQQAATKSMSDAVALSSQRQASLLDYYNNGSSSPFGNAFSSSLGTALGRTVGGGFSLAGNLLGSLFGR